MIRVVSWNVGKRGCNVPLRLAAADEETLAGALRTAWKLRVEKNAQARRRPRRASAHTGPA